MPTYQYACTNADCGNRFELVQSFTDDAVSECPVCGSPVRKVYGSVGVVFKGSGFYRNDSRSQNGSAVSAESSSGAKDTGTKDSSAKDSGAKDSGAKDSGSSSSTSASSSSGKDSSSSASGSSGSASSSSSSSSGKATSSP